MPRYQHTQTGRLIITVFVVALLISLYVMSFRGFDVSGPIILVVIGICMAFFATLTVIIDEEFLKIKFGIGIIRKKFPLKDIESCRAVKNAFWYGWGIRLTPHGWLYNVSGFDAVEIKMKTGKKYRIGTDVPRELENAVKEALRGVK